MSVVGKPIDRIDAAAKTTGAARFTAEHRYPGLAHAALVHATISRGKVNNLHTDEARKIPGVLAVITHRNAAKLKQAPKPGSISGMAAGTSVDYLQNDEVYWNGQPIAVVVAETPAAATEAAALIRAEYTIEDATVDFAGAEADAKPQPKSMLIPSGASKGDARAALAGAPVRVEQRYTTPPLNHNALEPHATTAAWDGDRLTLHDATQALDWFRDHLAMRFAIPAANVRIHAPYVGGGFGGKSAVWAGTILAALAARMVKRPVRLTLSREAVYRTVGGRTPSIQRVGLGATRDGRLTALVHSSITAGTRVGGFPEMMTSQSQYLYAAEHILAEQHQARLDWLPNAAMRAPGEATGTFALESAIDELACELGIDPVQLRLRNEPTAHPVDGKPFSLRLQREALTQGAERFGWQDRDPRPGSMRDGRWLVGMGVAAAFYPPMVLPANVTVSMAVDGSVVLRCGLQEMGMGAATAQAQIAADALGVAVDKVRVEYGDSDLPMAPAAGGSVQTASVAGAVLEACERLRASLAAMARRTGGDTVGDILRRARKLQVEASVGAQGRLGKAAGQAKMISMVMRQRRWAKAATGAHFCAVRVDPDTGEVRVTRWVGTFDIGRVVNHKTATSQLRGGIVMGLGMALSERTLIDSGRVMNPSLAEYHVPVHADIPPIDITFLDKPDPTTPLGIKGAGEVGITGVAAAVANAVHHATGKRIRDLPITLDKLL